MQNKFFKKLLLEGGYFSGRFLARPEFVSLLITYRCNFRCENCDIWKKRYPELSSKEWLIMAEKIKRSFPKGTFIEINGGEPLLRKELVLALVRSFKKTDNIVGINTNGYLVDKVFAHAAKKADADFVKVSLYSLSSTIHDLLRGFSGAHKAALRAIDNLIEENVKTEIGIIITRKNIDGIPFLMNQMMRKRGDISFILQPLDEKIESEAGNLKDENVIDQAQWPSRDQVEDLFEEIWSNRHRIKNWPRQELIKKYYIDPENILRNRCFVGQRNLVIYPDGKVSFCFKGNKFGNLNEEELDKLLSGQKAEQERRRIRGCRKYCRIVGCNYSMGFREFFNSILEDPRKV